MPRTIDINGYRPRPLPQAQQGKGAGKGYEIRAIADGEAELLIYSEISRWWGTDPEWFVRDLRAISAPVIRVRINSPGGDVFGGILMYNALVQHSARIIVHVEGVAASIASIVAMAGDEIIMAPGTFMMIHNPHLIAIGDARDMRAAAELLDKVGISMAGIYAARTGASEEQVLEWMADETWFTAAEAREAGFADAEEGTAAPAARFDYTLYAHAPEVLRNAAPREPAAPAGERPKINTPREFEAFLRDEGGFGHAAAKAIAAGGFKARTDPREEDAGPTQPTAVEPPAEDGDAVALEALSASILTTRLAVRRRA